MAKSMDKRVERALEFVNYRRTLSNQVEQAKTRALNNLTYSINGGIFEIDTSLISFVDLLISKGKSSACLLDKNNLPINIDDLDSFQEEILSRYVEVINDYYQEWESLRKARSVKSILDLEL